MADTGKRPLLLRYPFLWAFLLGVIVLTLIRPCLRRIPEPPPVTGRFPAVTLTDAQGEAIDPANTGGSIVIVLYLRGGCGEPCSTALERQREVQETYAVERVAGIRLLTIVAEEGPAPAGRERLQGMAAKLGAVAPGWSFASGDAATLATVEAAMGGGEAPSPARLAIVDSGGNLRGTYAADADGFNEVYNRARHVRDAPPSAGGARAGGAH